MSFEEKLRSYTEYFNEKAAFFFDSVNAPSALNEAMKYSFFAGGKRLRPSLVFLVAEILGLNKDSVFKYALAIELIHNYSLVHDDLPCMDNDDLRRGKPTAHKKFGEALAVLSGDAMLNLAYEVLFSINDGFENSSKAKLLISNKAGASGMVKGQVYDMFGPEEKGEEGLYSIIDNKTSALIEAAILTPSVLLNNACFDDLSVYARKLGELFQISDDILDYEGDATVIGKNVKKDGDKNTFVNFIGIAETKKLGAALYKDCVEILKPLKGFEPLIEATDYIYNRKK